MDEDLVKKLREESTFVQSEKKHIVELYRQVKLFLVIKRSKLQALAFVLRGPAKLQRKTVWYDLRVNLNFIYFKASQKIRTTL
jgi:hypothetical protein